MARCAMCGNFFAGDSCPFCEPRFPSQIPLKDVPDWWNDPTIDIEEILREKNVEKKHSSIIDHDKRILARCNPKDHAKEKFMMIHDVFICHASEDKDDFVRPLAEELIKQSLKIWYDEFALTVGDNLRRSIDKGLAHSRYGIVVLSPNFFVKEWSHWELDGLVSREIEGEKVILPIWHNIIKKDIMRYSPSLANLVAVSSSKGLDHVVKALLRAICSAQQREKMDSKETIGSQIHKSENKILDALGEEIK